MNYLAHLFLAGENHGMILGSLLEDYITGGIENERNRSLPEDVKRGLGLHRFIDTQTDTDPRVSECKKLFYPKFAKYSSVIVDVIFDHYLQKNWNRYSTEEFSAFRKRIYKSLGKEYLDIQPLGLKRLVASMIEHDWLKNYIHFWGVERALSSLNHRVVSIDLTEAVQVMKENYDYIEGLFLEFFDDLKEKCDGQ